MATQKEALLDVLGLTKEYVANVLAPTKKHEKAKQTVLNLLKKRIESNQKQLDVYFANLENKKKQSN
jgi:hypothetical protein